MPVISRDLQDFMTEWTLHDISSCSKEGGPQKTEIFFYHTRVEKEKKLSPQCSHDDKTLYTRRAVCLNSLPCLI
jgi:hypothetical protein